MRIKFFGRWLILGLGGIFIFAFLISTSAQAAPVVHYVAPGTNCNGAQPCYADIDSAIEAAANYDEIRVAQGTYTQISMEDDITSVVHIVDKRLTLTGGYSTADWNTSNPAAYPTIISAQNNGIGIYVNYQADVGIGEIVIDGFSVTGGNATEAVAGTDSGGGILIDHTTHVRVTIQNCKIYGNTAEGGYGGGIYSGNSDNLEVVSSEIYENAGTGIFVSFGDNPAIVDNLVTDNTGVGIYINSDYGGGTDIHGNEISGNQDSGIALSSVLGGSIVDNLITDNHTTGGGGGLDISGATNDFLISENIVRGNSSMQGGGIDISGSVAQIKDNLIESNYTTPSSNGGGGLYINSGASGAYVLVSGNRILSNSSTNQGGGLLALGSVDIIGNTITGNSATSGGGLIATITGVISNNLISSNVAQSGGGIRTVNAMGTILERNRIIDNHATNGDGGGMNLWGGFFMDIALDGNQVISNTATAKGGGIYMECPIGVDPIDVANTILVDNLAGSGSGLYMTVCEANIAYSTVASNRGVEGDGIGLYLRDPSNSSVVNVVENSIVVSQTIGIYVESGSVELEATFWGDGVWANGTNTAGPGSIDLGDIILAGDPLFLDPAKHDYHVASNSPAIDEGIDTWTANDVDGQPRLAGETDIGADEFWLLWTTCLPLILR